MFDDATNLIHQRPRDLLSEAQEWCDRNDAEKEEREREARRRAKRDKENRRRRRAKEPESDVSEDWDNEGPKHDTATSPAKYGGMDNDGAWQSGQSNDGRSDAREEQRGDEESAREAQAVLGARKGHQEVLMTQDHGHRAVDPQCDQCDEGEVGGASAAVHEVNASLTPALAATPAGSQAGAKQQGSTSASSAEDGAAGAAPEAARAEPEPGTDAIAQENIAAIGGFVGSLVDVNAQAGTVALTDKGRLFRRFLFKDEPAIRCSYTMTKRVGKAARAEAKQRTADKRKAEEARYALIDERDAKRRRMQHELAAASQEQETSGSSAPATLTPNTYYNTTTAESRPDSDEDEIPTYEHREVFGENENGADDENEAASESEHDEDGPGSYASD